MNTRRNTGTKASTLARLAVMCLVVLHSLLPAQAQTVTTLVQFTNVWKYDQTGAELGTAWRTNDYDDSAWAQGPGLLGVDEPLTTYRFHAPVNTLFSTPLSQTVTTYYFRTTFAFSGSKQAVVLVATNLVDDGCAIYLNGRLVGGVRMPVSFNATTVFSGPTTEGQLDVVALTNHLIQGVNTLAVEVHQAAPTSADILFGMRLMAFEHTPLVITNQPQDHLAIVGEAVSFRVGVSGGPVSYRWLRDGLPASSTGDSLVIANAQPASAGNYQVICSNLVSVVTSSVARLTVLPDRTGPRALAAVADGGARSNSIVIQFSEPLRIASATNLASYIVTRLGTSGTVTVTNVLYNVAAGSLLQLDGADTNWIRRANYTVTINNVTDLKTNVIAPNTTLPVAWAYTNSLISSAQLWDYHASAIFEPDVYAEPWSGFDYAPGPWWGQGFGPFYGGVVSSSPCAGFPAAATQVGFQPEPILYRTSFQWPPGWPTNGTLRVGLACDDGAVLFLNGMEIYRTNVSASVAAPVTATTRAMVAANLCFYDRTNPALSRISIPLSMLRPGRNLLAAAVTGQTIDNHFGNTDMFFAMDMEGVVLIAPELASESSQLRIAPQVEKTLHLSWPGAGFLLESSTNLSLGSASYPIGPWTEVSQMANPYLWSVTNEPVRFFRLKK